MFKHPHMSPLLFVDLYVLGVSACDMGMQESHMLDIPQGGVDSSPCVQHPPCIVCAPVYLYNLRDICRFYGQDTSYVGGLGVSAHLSGFWCLSVHPLDVHYASSCAVLVVYYAWSLYYHSYNYYSSSDCGVFWYVISIISDCGSLFDGASYNVGSAWCDSAATPDTKILLTCSWPCHSSKLHLQSLFRPMPFMSWVLHREVSFSKLSLPTFCILYVWCLFCCLLSTFRCPAGCHIHPWGLNHLGLHPCNPLEFTCGRHMCNLVMVIIPHQVCTEWLLPPLHWVGGSLLLLSLLFPRHPIYMVGHTAFGDWQRVTRSLHLPYMVGRGLFQLWFHPMTWLTLNLWWVLNLVILV